MSKKISKLLLTLLLIIVALSSFSVCFAEVGGETTKAITTSETEKTTTTEDTTSTEDEIYNGDLYLFDNDIVMDKLPGEIVKYINPNDKNDNRKSNLVKENN